VPRQADLSFDRSILEKVPSKRIRWKTTYRLQSARHPPVDFFERVASVEERDALNVLEQMTDPGARQAIGRISLIPPSRRVFGPGASGLMWPFTHPSKDNASRFSDGAYGVYYAGHAIETALREIAYHRARFHARTRDAPTRTTFKTIEASVDKVLHDIRLGDWSRLLDPDPASYATPQSFAAQLRDAGSPGIVYPSVRPRTGECVAAFWPNVMAGPIEGKRIALQWDGNAIATWFDFERSEWFPL
jgi:hypothetical protein